MEVMNFPFVPLSMAFAISGHAFPRFLSRTSPNQAALTGGLRKFRVHGKADRKTHWNWPDCFIRPGAAWNMGCGAAFAGTSDFHFLNARPTYWWLLDEGWKG